MCEVEINRKLSASEIKAIVRIIWVSSLDDIVYALELAMQKNEDLFVTIVKTIKPSVGHEAIQAMIQGAVENANIGEHTKDHSCPIFLQVRRLAGLYLDTSNHVQLCEECGKTC